MAKTYWKCDTCTNTAELSAEDHAEIGTPGCCDEDMVPDPELWQDTYLQAVRLIGEICATQDALDTPALCEAMDLEPDELTMLFDRIQKEWDDIKANM